MERPDNAVGRLATLLERARGVKGSIQRDALATLFGVDAEDQAQLLFLMSQLLRSVDEARAIAIEAAEALDYPRPLVKSAFDRLDDAFKQHLNLSGEWAPLQIAIKSEFVVSLDHIAVLVFKYKPSRAVPEDALQQVQVDVEALMEDLDGAELDPKLKLLIREKLLNILRAITHYQIRGLDGLEAAVDEAVGTILRVKKPLERDGNAGVLVRFMGVLVVLDKLLSIAKQTTPMLTVAARSVGLLPPGDGAE